MWVWTGPILWEFLRFNSLKHSWDQELFGVRMNTTMRTKLGKKLCDCYCLSLHKTLKSSRHHVHFLASKLDNNSLRKVQSHKLPILMQLHPTILSLVSAYSFALKSFCVGECLCWSLIIIDLSLIFIHVGDCWVNRLIRPKYPNGP